VTALTVDEWTEYQVRHISERAYQAHITTLATAYGWRWHHETDSAAHQAGLPDLILVKPPRLMVLEVKTERGKATDKQMDWLADLARVPGVLARLVRPSDWGWLESELTRP
jgi:hypothetical protein